jgi:uncharacterized protein YyaL (SSP411 family)
MPEKYNRLIHEKSPYLQQHKDNPVHWYAWGEEAFKAAKEEKKPIFLSIGYSTCHWCHVMEHESFERDEVAQVLNEKFISIKVDREERPDVDEIYMAAVHTMGMRGGWPLSVFLTPDLKPFYGGTYWPREYFIQILNRLAQIWKEQPEKIFDSSEQIFEMVKAQKSASLGITELTESIFSDFYRYSSMSFDPIWGGFGPAPKFPHSMQISMLLRIYRRTREPHALQMVTKTLEKMARGGIYDHLGGGFARYSTDERWLVPHFEKMLYDNALLAKTYLEAYQTTQIETFASVARETLDYVLRDMTHPEGGFYSAEDADSEGEEGKFYVWKESELKDLLTAEEFELFAKVYGITSSGNFEHKSNILSLQENFQWEDKENPLLKSAYQKLFEVRSKRIRPHRDDKILTSWNGLMISAMTMAYRVLPGVPSPWTGEGQGEGDPTPSKYLEAAKKAVNFIQKKLYKDQKLLARYRDGEGRFAGYLDDYAYLIQGLLDLYECNFDPEILKWAITLQNKQQELFEDKNQGGFFFTDGSDASILVRSKECTDGAIPNGNAVSTLNLLRLYHLTFENHYQETALKIFRCFSKIISEYPHALSQMLIAYDFLTDSTKEIAVITPDKTDVTAKNFLKELQKDFFPNKVIALGLVGKEFPPLLKGKPLLEGKTTFYVCEDQLCQSPTSDGKLAMRKVSEYRSYSLLKS